MLSANDTGKKTKREVEPGDVIKISNFRLSTATNNRKTAGHVQEKFESENDVRLVGAL